jgi:ATP phosphoribosyltransferase regulatory subunit
MAIDLPEAAKIQAMRLAETVGVIHAQTPGLALTVDPIEFRGYQYHTGICMTIFAKGRQAELGRGGRYLSGNAEPATGITLYPDTIVRFAPSPNLRPRLYLPYGTTLRSAEECRQRGFATISGLGPETSFAEEAARMCCSHLYIDGQIIELAREVL